MMNRFFRHLHTVIIHKHFVFINCCKAGLVWRGIKHDMSKFSPTEFMESVKYFTGDRSPIDNCKDKNGVSYAWMHHKGRNSHHYEYWVDNLDKGGIPVQMPFDDALEMICDFLGAGMAYSKNSGKEFNYANEYDVWWKNKTKDPIAMHEQTKLFCDIMLKKMKEENSNDCIRKVRALEMYKVASINISNENK